MYDSTFELLQKLGNAPPLLWEVQIPKPSGDGVYEVQFTATEAELLSALLDLNAQLGDNGIAMLDQFLYSFDVSADDVRRAYASDFGWSLECWDCFGTATIGYDVSHEIRGRDVVFIWTFDPAPVSCILACHGIE